jgi:hypothetical protein
MSSPIQFDAVIDVQVFQDNNYCSVTLSGPEWEASGNARRNPDDDPHDEIGFLLALGRALENAGRKLQKRANGLVKHADDVQTAKYVARIARNLDEMPTYEDLARFLRDIGADGSEEFPYIVTNGGFSPGPDFSDPNDPAFNLLGRHDVIGYDPTDDGESIFVRFHFAGADD